MNTLTTRVFMARTGFDPRNVDVAAVEPLDQNQLARRTVQQAQRNDAVLPVSESMNTPFTSLMVRRTYSDAQRQTYRQSQNQTTQAMRVWWLAQMLHTATPLRERMVLFWHNHFATSAVKVIDAQLMWKQHQLLRTHALGSFKSLLHGMTQDPAMLIYLDGAQNKAQAPNENFAREVMELFTLGQGAYTETDIKQAARAFTGYTVDPKTNAFMFDRRRHDSQPKTVLGRTVDTGEQVIAALLEQPRCAQFIVEKLWREFISPQPAPGAVKRIAEIFRAQDYQIAPVLVALFSEAAILSLDNEAALVKSPVELLVGTVRRFDMQVNDVNALALASASMGQVLFAPPNVKGWPGGEAWINANTLLARKQAIARLFKFVPEGKSSGFNLSAIDPALKQSQREKRNADISMSDLTGTARELPRRFRIPVGMSGAPYKPTEVGAAIVFDPSLWLTKQGVDPLNTVREPQRTDLINSILYTQPALTPDSSLEGMPLLHALVSDAAYQVK